MLHNGNNIVFLYFPTDTRTKYVFADVMKILCVLKTMNMTCGKLFHDICKFSLDRISEFSKFGDYKYTHEIHYCLCVWKSSGMEVRKVQ